MITVYRALLRLYPAAFRNAYGEEMTAAFRERWSRPAGAVERAGLLAATFADILGNAAAAHGEIVAQDVRYAGRLLVRAPGFAATVIVVIAFGVGVNAAVFTVADFVLVRPLPFPGPDRLVRIWEAPPGYSRLELSPANLRDWREATSSFASMGWFNENAMNLVDGGLPSRIEIAQVSLGLFHTLGVQAALGRVFAPDGGEETMGTVVLSHGLWQTELGGDPAVLGRTVQLDGSPYEIVGVMPETFRFPSRETRLWMPIDLTEEAYLDRTNNFLEVVARLAPGVTVEEARMDLQRAAARVAARYPDTNGETRANLYLLGEGLGAGARVLIGALAGAAICILVLACANLTNLFLARGAARAREVAVRAALGAGRERLVRQLLTESALLTLAGGAAGLALGVSAVPMLAELVPTELPIAARPETDLRVLGLGLVLVAATGLGFGVLPALRASGGEGLHSLRGGHARARTSRLRAGLVSVQVAASLVLLVGVGLLGRAMLRLQGTDPGFRVEDVLTLRTALPWPAYAETSVRNEFYDRVVNELRALPGVEEAAYTTGLPMVVRGGIWPVSTVEEEQLARSATNTASLRFVTPGFFEALGIPLLRGRAIERGDTFDDPFIAVVSESLADRYWPGRDPLGQRFEFGLAERTVVGVVRDIRVRGLEEESEPQVYLPARQVPDGWLVFYTPKDLVVRSDQTPASLLPAIREIVESVDPDQPVSDVRTMAEVVAGSIASRASQLRVLGILAGTALLLAAIGLHGLLAFTVSLRTREIGVRLALGARRGRVARMVLGEGLALVAVGVLGGVAVAFWAARLLGALLFGVRPGDPVVFGAAVLITTLLGVAASAAPAFRAVRLDPAEVVRE